MKEIAILIPAYNEELTIQKVIKDFKKQLPDAKIYVYNNNSIDKTEELSKAEGAIVKNEIRQGKGNVVRRMFKEIDADIYVMVDADDTYPAESVKELIQPILEEKADMVNGNRLINGTYFQENKRQFHYFGNKLVSFLISKIYNRKVNDIMTGYRAFNYEFVKGMPILSQNFEIETEITLHCLDKNYRLVEIPIEYRDRLDGSISKLNTFKDGISVIKTIFDIYKNYKPMSFFGIIATIFLMVGIIFGILPIYEFVTIHYITRIPMTVLTALCVIISVVLYAIGIILDVIIKLNKQNYELFMKNIKR